MDSPRLYYMTLSEAEKLPGAVCETFFPCRMQKARRYVKREDYLRSVAAGALVCGVMGLREEDIAIGPHGKPYPLTGEARFSLSHSGAYIILLISPHEVGTDIEQIAPFHAGVAERVFTADELAWLNAIPGESRRVNRFYTLWTLKESVLKLDGRGFALSPSSFSVMPILSGNCVNASCGTVYGCHGSLGDCAYAACSLQPLANLTPEPVTAEQFLAHL